MLILPERNALFVCIPRTGSRSIAEWLHDEIRGISMSAHAEAERSNSFHSTIEEAQAFTDVDLDALWSFAVARHPLDRLVSVAAMRNKEFSRAPRWWIARALDEFDPEDRWMMPQVAFTAGVDAVYRYEALGEAFAILARRLGVGGQLGRFHESQRPAWRDCFDAALRDRAAEIYAADFEAFGYEL